MRIEGGERNFLAVLDGWMRVMGLGVDIGSEEV